MLLKSFVIQSKLKYLFKQPSWNQTTKVEPDNHSGTKPPIMEQSHQSRNKATNHGTNKATNRGTKPPIMERTKPPIVEQSH